jgi:hypothetical protein
VLVRRSGPMLTLIALALLVAALPELLRRLESLELPSRTLAVVAPADDPPPLDPALRPLALLEGGLMQRLDHGDRDWIPRAEPLPEGGTRYMYRRRPGDPELSLAQIRALIAQPPSHAPERRAIVDLLTTLEQVGAGVGLIEPIKTGAAAEWDPRARTIRVRPDVPDQGSLEFARVLNHEAIHVAQSCAAGGVASPPRPLGLVAASEQPHDTRVHGGETGNPEPSDPSAFRQLQDPLYADLSPSEQRMEKEAYALQNRLDLGVKLLRIQCLDGRAG